MSPEPAAVGAPHYVVSPYPVLREPERGKLGTFLAKLPTGGRLPPGGLSPCSSRLPALHCLTRAWQISSRTRGRL